MDLSILFVNWNSLAYLRECLASIYQHTHSISFEIIVVDNASTEPGIERLIEEFPGAIVIRSDKNLGFAGANNLAFARSTGETILFLNPDTALIQPSLNVLLHNAQLLPKVGIIGCRLLNTDLTIQTSCIQTFPTIANQIMDFEYLRLRWPNCRLWRIGPLFSTVQSPEEVDVISGACMMIGRKTFTDAGMFSEDYFMYAEDLDLCYKVNQLGLINYFVGTTAIVHHGGKSTRQTKVSQWATTMKFRAVQKFCVKTHGPFYGAVYRFAMGAAAINRVMILSIASQFLNNRVGRSEIKGPIEKWRAVAKWAFGFDNTLRKANS
jgi:GT2 family glycosyltransferase